MSKKHSWHHVVFIFKNGCVKFRYFFLNWECWNIPADIIMLISDVSVQKFRKSSEKKILLCRWGKNQKLVPTVTCCSFFLLDLNPSSCFSSSTSSHSKVFLRNKGSLTLTSLWKSRRRRPGKGLQCIAVEQAWETSLFLILFKMSYLRRTSCSEDMRYSLTLQIG